MQCATVLPAGVLVRRIQGASFFAPATEIDADTFVSVLGEVEVLRRDGEGWTLVQADGRVLGFDRDGRVDLLDGATRLIHAPVKAIWQRRAPVVVGS